MNSRGGAGGAGAVIALLVVVVLVFFGIFVWFAGSENPSTPAGNGGYLYQKAVFGSMKFVNVQLGPTSPGRTWMLDVINVSLTPKTYTEPFDKSHKVLSKDDLPVEFNVHVLIKVRSGKSVAEAEKWVKVLVEKYTTLEQMAGRHSAEFIAYRNFLSEPIRNWARDAVQALDALKIKTHLNDLNTTLTAHAQAFTENTPFEVSGIVVGNIQYPEEVTNAVSKKLKADQDNERLDIEIKQQGKEAQKRVKDAEGIAKAMEIINKQLSWQYLQHEAIEAQKLMANSPNHTTVYIPSGPMGVPLVGTFDTNNPGPKVTTSEKK